MTWPAACHAYDLLRGANVNKTVPPVGQSDRSRKRPLEESSVTSSQSQSCTHTQSQSHTNTQSQSHTHSHSHSDSSSASVAAAPQQPQSSNSEMSMFASPFMELTHSLGLDPSGLNSVFDVPTYSTWPSNNSIFTGMQGDLVRNSGMLLERKDPG